ncbi:MAG: dihydroorotate dehydrogenase electron transfer subunit [Clostridia bacterium]|nr:dihydroorotate dehydrogenase electron transfer subunit [Clostridia bacterium]
MDDKIFTLISNENIANGVYKAVLSGDTSAITVPGQFVNLKLDGLYLRRPISVCDCEGERLTLIYKVVGEGTEQMSEMTGGERLDVLTGLGNGFSVSKCQGDDVLLVGGGVGVPPLYMLCKRLIEAGKRVTVVCGFASAADVFYEQEFAALGAKVYIATADGSYGTKGFVTDVIKGLSGYTYFYSCGPIPMFKAMETVVNSSGQYSFEERMGCGFGACMGCSCETKYGNKRICRDGPVLEREEVIW